jgi:hypothetical protein
VLAERLEEEQDAAKAGNEREFESWGSEQSMFVGSGSWLLLVGRVARLPSSRQL